MRHVIFGSFVGFVLAAAFLAACGSSGNSGPSQATVDELAQQIAALEADLATHEADQAAHHQQATETPWLGMFWCIALEGVFPSRNLQMPNLQMPDEGGTYMSADPTLGSVALFAGDFAPRGWATCSGQLLSITQNPALYSLLGTTYGGDGLTTFALPDLRGRTPVGVGTGTGLPPVTWGQQGP